MDANSHKRILPLSECLMKIRKQHPGKKIDVVIDELDSEDLDQQEVNKVNSILDEPEFKTSKILIAFQCCQKKRLYKQEFKTSKILIAFRFFRKKRLKDQLKKETSICYTDLKGFKQFTLDKSMRFTSKICGTLKKCEEKVEENPSKYSCNLSKFDSNKSKAVDSIHKHIQEEEEHEGIRGPKQLYLPGKSSMKQPSMKIDASLRYAEVDGGNTKITVNFDYIKAKGSGHNIKGDNPNLLQVNSNRDVRPLAYFIQKYCIYNPESDLKLMIICNTQAMVNLAKASLKTCKLPFIQYTDDIDAVPAKSTALKKNILEMWQQDKDILLVDCRGCKGMECQEVIHVSFKNYYVRVII